jgi:hypothetical protein
MGKNALREGSVYKTLLGHVAMDTATDLFTTEVLRFLEGP